MEDRRTPSFSLPWPLILTLMAAGGGLVLLRSPLISSRPAEDRHHERLLLGDQDVEARLWQDPFKALELHKTLEASKKLGPHSVSNLALQIQQQRRAFPSNEVRVLLVMVPGGPYIEDAETRLRSRHAMVSALDVAGFAPEDPERVGFVKVSWSPGTAVLTPPSLPPLLDATDDLQCLEIPFEWFYARRFHPPVHAEPALKKILILWLKEDAFSDLPAIRLAQLKQQLQVGLPSTGDATSRESLRQVTFSILGPRSSSTLQRMLPDYDRKTLKGEEAKHLKGIQDPLGGVTMYSYSATAMEDLLVRDRDTATNGLSSVAAWLTNLYHLDFKKVVFSDDQLAGELIQELHRRGVDVTNSQHCVALISEHDTLYGRLLPFAFAVEVQHQSATNHSRSEIIQNLRTSSSTQKGSPVSHPWPTNLWRFSYLRGIDGKMPGDEPSSGSKSAGKRNETAENQNELERAQGQNQLDYIPRLAGLLHAQDEESRRNETGSLKAIGILGSDLYDKLLILQALRARFPGVIFFTTDLDARLWHPSQMEWSRNLVVASSFGLELNPDIQGRIAPFRDSSQTALFYTGLRALGHCLEIPVASLRPRLHEIGRSGAWDLSVDVDAGKRATGTASITTLHPKRTPPLHWWTVPRIGLAIGLISASLVLAVWAVLLQRGTSHWDLDLRRVRNWTAWNLGFLLVLGLSGWMLFRSFAWQAEEPLSFWDGISLWPTEALRLLAALLGFHFLIKAIHDLHASKERIQVEFHLDTPDTGTQFFKKLGHWWDDPRRQVSALWSGFRFWAEKCLEDRRSHFVRLKGEQQETEDVQQVWADYLRSDSAWNRTWRVLAAVVIYYGFSYCLIHLFPTPNVPFRGEVTYRVDVVVRYLSLIVLMGLMFYAADATRFCVSFIKRLVEKRTTWNGLDAQANPCGLCSEDLESWREIQLIGQVSAAVGRLILYPFFVLALLIVARSPYFDNWTWPLSVLLILGVNSLYAIILVLALRRAAETARKKSLLQLNDALFAELGRPKSESSSKGPNRAEQLRALIREIESIREGAFAPLSQHPLIAALLMPFGGAGVLVLLEQLAH